MKKNNIILTLVSAVALLLYIVFFVVRVNLFEPFVWSDLFRAFLVCSVAMVCFLLFVLKSKILMLVIVFGAGLLATWTEVDFIYTIFPIWMSVWFVEHGLKKGAYWLSMVYYGTIAFCLGLGFYILINKQQGNFYHIEEEQTLQIIFTVGLFVLLLLLSALVMRQHNLKEKNTAKKKMRALSNHMVAMCLITLLQIVEWIIFWVKAGLTDRLTIATLVLAVVYLLWLLLQYNALQKGNQSVWKKMQQLI